jgi:hypothetical protein
MALAGDGADTGGAWRYFNRYCESAGKQPADLRMHVLKRTAESIALILDTIEGLDRE